MNELILSRVWSFVIKRLPSIFLRRMIKVSSIEQDFEVDLRSINSVKLNMNSSIPELTIWLSI